MTFSEYYNQLAHRYPIDDLKYLLAILIIFYITLVALRINGVMKKDFCPKCGGNIKRIPKNLADRIYAATTLGIIPLRRYKCEVCFWKGLRWNTEKAVFTKKRKRRTRKLSNDSEGNSKTTTS